MRALITGGSGGIGLAAAQTLHKEGAEVALIARDPSRLQAATERLGPRAHRFVADMADARAIQEAVQDAVRQLGGLDVVITAAGYGTYFGTDTPYRDAVKAWDDEVGVNLRGPFLTIQAATPHLTRPGGRIITISSIAAYTGGSRPGAAGYAAAKAGLLGLTRGLARELTPHGITVNAIVPGFIDTDFHGPDRQALIDAATETIPAGRVGRPDDVAATATFLASPAADYISGQVLHVNGGWHFGS